MEVDAAGLDDFGVAVRVTVTVFVTPMQEQNAEADDEGSASRVERRALSALQGLTVIASSSLPRSFPSWLRFFHSPHPVGLAVTVVVTVEAGNFELQ